MKIAVFIKETLLEKYTGTFWAMPKPEIKDVLDLKKETIINAIKEVHALITSNLINGTDFEIYNEANKKIFYGHINNQGSVDVFHQI